MLADQSDAGWVECTFRCPRFGCARSILRSRWRIACLLPVLVATVGCLDEAPTVSTKAPPTSQPTLAALPEQDESDLIWGDRFPEMGTELPQLNRLDDELLELQEALGSSYLTVRVEAIESMGRLSLEPDSQRASDVFLLLMNHRRIEFNDYEDRYVDAALRAMGPAAIAQVLRLVESDQLRDLANACEAMRAIGEAKFTDFQPVLEKLLKSDSPARNWGGMYALEQMGASGAVLLPLVDKFLLDQDFQNQIIALRALAAMGPKASGSWETVAKLTQDGQNISVKSHASRTLGYISTADPQLAQAAAELLGENLTQFAFMIKSRAFEGLIVLREQAAPVQEQAQRLMQDTTGLAAQAAMVYGYTSQDWTTAVQRLEELLEDPIIGIEALQFFKHVGSRGRPAAESLLKLAEDEDDTIALAAAEALAAQWDGEKAEAMASLEGETRAEWKRVVQQFRQLAADGSSDPNHFAQLTLQRWMEQGWLEGLDKRDDDQDAENDSP